VVALHLKSLTLKGFKSFAQPTTLAFEPGVTCVVGPNGSGKSNVVDALAWVMGEQGAKTLRGGKMEDVIFAGTETRGPLGRAEVQLTIDNTDGALPIDYTEVTISRTLFRNGGSEYAINGEPCRLLDVQELLSDTGLGREMHVIVGQGQLDSVLRATPLERRAFVEEAAGILKFRRRKEKTERKLEAMQANLTRLNDLAGELRRQLRPLGRQAEVAKQAQQIAAEARAAKSKLLAHQIVEIRAALETAAKSETERRTEASYVEQQLAANRAGVAELERSLLAGDFDKVRNRLFELESLEQRTRAALNLANQRLSLTAEPEAQIDSPGALRAELAQAQELMASLEVAVGQERETLEVAERERTAAAALLAEFDADQIRQRAEIEAQERERARLETAIQVSQSRRDTAVAARDRLGAAASEVAARVAELEGEHGELAGTLADVSDTGLRAALEKTQAAERKITEAIEQLREDLHAAERERDAVAARHSALSLTLDQTDGAKEVSSAKLSGVRGLLADSLKVDAGFETAIAVALGTLADAVAVDSRAAAIAGVELLKQSNSGTAEFLIVSGGSARRPKREVAGLVSADSVLEAPEAVLIRLENFFIAESLEQAARALDAGFDQTVITRDGDLLASSLVRGGGSKAPSKLELVSERDSAAAKLGELAKKLEKLEATLTARRAELTEAATESAQALAALQAHDAELGARAERAGKLLATLEAAKSEQARVARDIEAAALALANAETELAEAEQARSSFAETPSAADRTSEREELVATLEANRTRELELRVKATSGAERLRAAGEAAAQLSGRLADAEAALARNEARERERRAERDRAEALVRELPAVLELCERLSANARLSVRELEAERTKHNERLIALRAATETLQQKLNELNKNVHDVELRNHELRLNLQNLDDRVRSELSLGIDQLLADVGEVEATRDQLEREYRAAEARLAQLGQFNPLALEEFAALEQRHKYLTEQLEDLARARADLLGIIKDLDGKMQTIFDTAFADTAKAFEEVFPVLFPGGSGSLSLTDPSNLLETGVEVTVRPAGKRIERMSLLSGGERSLAAVALLIAIFKARPSPFYVLDEVEAALDDANLGRLLKVIESLRSNSQLIIVTHQKRTMEIADSLYGVSMNRDGMSAVVGQRLERAS
jgi:chromosome segregation protein